MPIHSHILDNPRADRVRRLADLTRAKGRERSGLFLIEGPQSVREAVAWKPGMIRDLYVLAEEEDDSYVVADPTLEAIVESSQSDGRDIYVHLASAEVMRRISPDAQGIAAVGEASAMDVAPDDVTLGERPLVAAFWQVRDPGNAGTVIRAADAAGCAAVVFVDACVDPLNPKVVRSTAGSLFHVPVLEMSVDGFLDWARDCGLAVVAADVHGADGLPPETLPGMLADPAAAKSPTAVLFGNEARGLEDGLLARMDRIVSIPMYGRAESLNLATSAAVMLMGMAMRREA